MQFLAYVVLVEIIIHNSGKVLACVFSMDLLKCQQPLVKIEPSINIVYSDCYRKQLANIYEKSREEC